MTIEAYRFGQIDIDGRSYRSDVIITPDGVNDAWWRKQSHDVVAADVADIVAAHPDVVVIGTGYFGRMAVSDDARRQLEGHGIEVRTARTGQAVAVFNRLQAGHARVVAALHLTC